MPNAALTDRLITRRQALLGAAGAAPVLAMGGGMAFAQTPEASPVASELSVRPDARTLTPEQRTAFIDVILAMKLKPSPWIDGVSVYDTFVLWHRDAFGCAISAAHMGPAFLPWHRMYLHLFQQQVSEIDSTVTLPYWNWAIDNEVDSYLWQDDFMGGNGDKDEGEAVISGPFQKGAWEITIFDYGDHDRFPYLVRDFGAGDLGPSLPTADDVDAALAISTYDAAPWNALAPVDQSFRNFLEGWRDCASQVCGTVDGVNPTCTGGHELHNRVHLWVAGEFAFAHEARGHTSGTPVAAEIVLGTMAANSSPNDPVFFLHHANIDRIWNAWLRRHGPNYLPVSGGPVGHNLNDPMWPYSHIGIEATPAMMLDSTALGYVYDTDA
jgi:tyrosinase